MPKVCLAVMPLKLAVSEYELFVRFGLARFRIKTVHDHLAIDFDRLVFIIIKVNPAAKTSCDGRARFLHDGIFPDHCHFLSGTHQLFFLLACHI